MAHNGLNTLLHLHITLSMNMWSYVQQLSTVMTKEKAKKDLTKLVRWFDSDLYQWQGNWCNMSQLLSLPHFKVENSFAQSLQSLCIIFTGKRICCNPQFRECSSFFERAQKLGFLLIWSVLQISPKWQSGENAVLILFSIAEFLVCQSASSLQVFVTRNQNSWRSRSFRGKKTKKAGHPSATLIDQSPQRPFFSFFSTSFQ